MTQSNVAKSDTAQDGASVMNVSVAWTGSDKSFSAVAGAHSLNIDPAQMVGAKPTEVLLMALGSCSSFDVVGILQKSRQAIKNVECQISAQRADAIPAIFTDIHLHFIVTGENLKPSAVEKAVALSADKYCSIGIMLKNGGVHITHDYEIIDQDIKGKA